LIFVWFVAIRVSGRCQVGRFVVVALCIVIVDALVIYTFCVVGVFVTSHVVIVVGIVDNKWSMGGLLGYVHHSYDAVVVVAFIVIKFVHVGMYE
jgi:hypothetical protein